MAAHNHSEMIGLELPCAKLLPGKSNIDWAPFTAGNGQVFRVRISRRIAWYSIYLAFAGGRDDR